MKLSRRGLNLLHRTFCHPAASFKHVLNRISFPADDQKQLVDKRIYKMYKCIQNVQILHNDIDCSIIASFDDQENSRQG